MELIIIFNETKNYEKRDYQDYRPILYGNIKGTSEMCMEWEKKCVNLKIIIIMKQESV